MYRFYSSCSILSIYNRRKGVYTIQQLHNDEPDSIVEKLVALALYADDPEFIQHTMIQYSQHKHDNVKGIAILCFGHLARRFGIIDKELVLPIVHAGLQDESEIVRGHADSALDDINMFAL